MKKIKKFFEDLQKSYEKIKNSKNKFKDFYIEFKKNKLDKLMIILGILGLLAGFQIFAWFVLIGISVKLYTFTEVIERDIVPYDFNKLLPPPPKK